MAGVHGWMDRWIDIYTFEASQRAPAASRSADSSSHRATSLQRSSSRADRRGPSTHTPAERARAAALAFRRQSSGCVRIHSCVHALACARARVQRLCAFISSHRSLGAVWQILQFVRLLPEAHQQVSRRHARVYACVRVCVLGCSPCATRWPGSVWAVRRAVWHVVYGGQHAYADFTGVPGGEPIDLCGNLRCALWNSMALCGSVGAPLPSIVVWVRRRLFRTSSKPASRRPRTCR